MVLNTNRVNNIENETCVEGGKICIKFNHFYGIPDSLFQANDSIMKLVLLEAKINAKCSVEDPLEEIRYQKLSELEKFIQCENKMGETVIAILSRNVS